MAGLHETNEPTYKKKSPPGPRDHPLFGAIPKIRRGPIAYLESLARDYGDIVKFRFFFWDAYLVNHPDYIRHILQENNRSYSKDTFSYQILQWIVGNGLLTSEGDTWLRQRRLMQPHFHRSRIEGFGKLMTDSTLELLEGWNSREPKQPLDISEEMMRLTLKIVGRALFSLDLSSEAETVGGAFTFANEFISHRVRSLLAAPLSVPTPRNRRFKQARRQLDDVVHGIISARRAALAANPAAGGNDLLAMLLEARHEDSGEGMTDRQLQDEVLTLLLAGHETTANALTWTWYLLSQNPLIAQKLEVELREVLDGRPPEMGDLPNLPYNKMVVQEALRLYPPAWIITRLSLEEDELGGYRIPARSVVDVSPYLMHRHPHYWEDPLSFDPERFNPERSAGRHAYSYFPFGGGPRLCIGRDFALVEAQLILAAVASRYRVHLAPGYQAALEPLITLRPLGGMPVYLEKLDG